MSLGLRSLCLGLVTLLSAGLLFESASQEEAIAAGRIELVAVPSRTVFSEPPPGRAGNMERLRWGLRDRYGRTVGTAIFSCRWHKKHERLCAGAIELPRGMITTAGTSETRSFGEWAVTGGTGVYHGAGGSLTFRSIGLRKLSVSITL